MLTVEMSGNIAVTNDSVFLQQKGSGILGTVCQGTNKIKTPLKHHYRAGTTCTKSSKENVGKVPQFLKMFLEKFQW